MNWGQPSTRVQDLIHAGFQQALESCDEWIDDIEQATLRSIPQISADPNLAAAVARAHRANLCLWSTTSVRTPGAPTAPLLDTAENVELARLLMRRGLDASARDIFRVAQNVAWRRWTDIAFGLGADAEELRDVLNAPMRRMSEFLDAACEYVSTQMQTERHHSSISRQKDLERRTLVESLLAGTDTDAADVENRLGYRLDLVHTAAVIWTDSGDDDASMLDHAAETLIKAFASESLSVTSGAQSRWVWAHQVTSVDCRQIEAAVPPPVRIAIGGPKPGISGFAQSHREALTAQRIMVRLRCPQRVLHSSTQLRLVGLVAENRSGATEFIEKTLGDFAFATPLLRTSVLTYIEAGCNLTQAAKNLFAHRNTLLHRLETAQRLLPRPLKDNLVDVAVALMALQWLPSPDAPPT